MPSGPNPNSSPDFLGPRGSGLAASLTSAVSRSPELSWVPHIQFDIPKTSIPGSLSTPALAQTLPLTRMSSAHLSFHPLHPFTWLIQFSDSTSLIQRGLTRASELRSQEPPGAHTAPFPHLLFISAILARLFSLSDPETRDSVPLVHWCFPSTKNSAN